jgi:hypothetical protein
VSEINKHDLAKELDVMQHLLIKHSICNDTSPLAAAYGACMRDSNDATWSYRISNLLFQVPNMGHTIPHDADDLTVSLSVKVKGPFHPDDKVRNPLTDLEFNVVVLGGRYDTNGDVVELISSWHLDKHIPENGEEVTKFIHPEYHMTYGGRRMWDKTSFDYGQTLILPTPRLNSPPMDGILGIDFVIHNYLKREQHKNLTTSREYQCIIQQAQVRMWKPYYLAIAKAYHKFDAIDFNNCITHKSLIPNLTSS